MCIISSKLLREFFYLYLSRRTSFYMSEYQPQPYKITLKKDTLTKSDTEFMVGLLTGEITKRAGQLSKSTMQFIVTIDGYLWRS